MPGESSLFNLVFGLAAVYTVGCFVWMGRNPERWRDQERRGREQLSSPKWTLIPAVVIVSALAIFDGESLDVAAVELAAVVAFAAGVMWFARRLKDREPPEPQADNPGGAGHE